MNFFLFDVFTCCCFILIRLHISQSALLRDTVDNVGSGVGALVNGITGDTRAKKICQLDTPGIIAYYNYTPETHKVTAKKGYVLKLHRCNTKKSCPNDKKVLIIQHGLLGSSEQFIMDPPNRGLGYVMADQCYDVWMPNNRGNLHSREGLKSWDFSWDNIAFEDFPLVFNYIQSVTNQTKFYYIGHSQGTSSIMALLSEYPEWNEHFHAVSLMAPVGFMTHEKLFGFTSDLLRPVLDAVPIAFEFLPRSGLGKMVGSVCRGPFGIICSGLLNLMIGHSDFKQVDRSMIPIYQCKFPSGISSCQHFGQEVLNKYFGRRLIALDDEPENFRVHQITAPLYLHYSGNDPIGDKIDVEQLVPMLSGSTDLRYQEIKGYNHLDFIQGLDAHVELYPTILKFFANHTS